MGGILGLLSYFGPSIIKLLVFMGWKEDQARLALQRVHNALRKTPASALPGEAEVEQHAELKAKLKELEK